MAPAIPCSFGSVILSTKTTVSLRKEFPLATSSVHQRISTTPSFYTRCFFFQPVSVRFFQKYDNSYWRSSHVSRSQPMAVVGTDFSTEEINPTVSSESNNDTVEASPVTAVASDDAASTSGEKSALSKRTRPVRRSEMPPVKDEDLVPGAMFKGKVRSIMPFGAFVDIGAFTEGLVHISNLSSEFVKDVDSLVSVGQEVEVKLLEVNLETRRISLSMRDSDADTKSPQKKERFGKNENAGPRTPRTKTSRSNQNREETKKGTNFVIGEDLVGTVKNIARSGAYISLPDGEEGFLPASEESEAYGTVLGTSSLNVGQEVSVQVFRVFRGQVTLTMKKEDDFQFINNQINKRRMLDGEASNPFAFAFRRNKEIAAFLDERVKIQNPLTSEVVEEVVETSSLESLTSLSFEPATEAAADESVSEETETNTIVLTDMLDESISEMSPVGHADDQSVIQEECVLENFTSHTGTLTEESVDSEDFLSADRLGVVTSVSAEAHSAASTDEEKSEDNLAKDTATVTPALVKKLREETGAAMMDCKNALVATGGNIAEAQEALRKKGLASAEKRAGKVTAEGRVGSYIHDGRIGVLVEVNCETDFVSRGEIFKGLVEDLAMQVAACPQVQCLVPEDVPEEVVIKEREIEMQKEDLQSKPEQFRVRIVEGRIKKRLQELSLLEQPYIKNDKIVVKDWVKQTIASVGENIKVKRFVRFNLGEGLEKRSEDFAAEVAAQTISKESPPQAPTEEPSELNEAKDMSVAIPISATLVKTLREVTGAGMMDCKKALAETAGDLEKAQEYLRKKGIASAVKKSSRITAEGRITSYVHDSRIGALIEVNSETDFVARNEKFKELVNDLAMQVVACPLVQFASVEDIPESVVLKEKEIEMQREDLQSKPEHIREKIVDGRISKRLSELALLEQPYIKDDSLLVKDLVNQTIAALGENIKVRRFARFTLGE